MPQNTFRPFALRKHRLFESTDLDETREHISRVMQPHALVATHAHAMRSYMDFAQIDQIGIGAIAFGTPARVDVEAVSGYYLLMFCLSGQAEVRLSGDPVVINHRQAVLRAPGESFHARLSGDCEQLVLRINPAAFQTAGIEPPAPSTPVMPLCNEPMLGWKDLLLLISSSPDLLDSACMHTAVGTHLESLLIGLLAPALIPRHHPVSCAAPRIVHQAEALMRENLAAALPLADLALAVGVSVRTLCDAFQRFRATSPMLLFRQMRLDQARRDILEDVHGQRITTIALNCGFSHLGRFALSYRQRFGESPSDTARMRRRRAI